MSPPIGEPSCGRSAAWRGGRRLLSRLGAAMALPLVLAALTPAGHASTAAAVMPEGEGVLRKCRGWVVMTSCRTYHHIALPDRIAVGDTVTISFGGHPKEFGFYVAKIVIEGARCTLLSEAGGDPDQMDRITVMPCRPAPASP